MKTSDLRAMMKSAPKKEEEVKVVEGVVDPDEVEDFDEDFLEAVWILVRVKGLLEHLGDKRLVETIQPIDREEINMHVGDIDLFLSDFGDAVEAVSLGINSDALIHEPYVAQDDLDEDDCEFMNRICSRISLR